MPAHASLGILTVALVLSCCYAPLTSAQNGYPNRQVPKIDLLTPATRQPTQEARSRSYYNPPSQPRPAHPTSSTNLKGQQGVAKPDNLSYTLMRDLLLRELCRRQPTPTLAFCFTGVGSSRGV